MSKLKTVLKQVQEELAQDPELKSRGWDQTEAQLILLHVLENQTGSKWTRADLTLEGDYDLSEELAVAAKTIASRRAKKEPLQYLLGWQQFLEHRYKVGSGVLVPRPETETLVLDAEELLRKQPQGPRLGIEIGLGSGAISIELLTRFPLLRMIGTEVSSAARSWAEKNSTRILGEKNKERLQILPIEKPEEVLEGLPEKLAGARADFLISNPPYLDPSDEMDIDVTRHEPKEALFPLGGDPLYFYLKVAFEAGDLLLPGAPVFLEIPHQRAAIIDELFTRAGWTTLIRKDLAGRDRVLIAKKIEEQGRIHG